MDNTVRRMRMIFSILYQPIADIFRKIYWLGDCSRGGQGKVRYTVVKPFNISVYMEIGNQEGDTAEIEFDFDGVNSNRRWDIKVTQIECTNRGRL